MCIKFLEHCTSCLLTVLDYFCGNRDTFTAIQREIHDLNYRLSVFLKDVKQAKFERLVPAFPDNSHHPANTIIVVAVVVVVVVVPSK